MLEPLTQDALRGLEVPLLDLHLEEQRKRPHVLVVVLEEDVLDLAAADVQPVILVAKLGQKLARLHVQGIGLDRLLQPVDDHVGLVALGVDLVDGHAPAREPGEELRAHEAVGGRLDKRHERGHVLLARDLRDIGPEPHGRHVLGLQLENLPAKAVGFLQLAHPQLQRGLLEFDGGAVRDDFRDVAVDLERLLVLKAVRKHLGVGALDVDAVGVLLDEPLQNRFGLLDLAQSHQVLRE